MRWLVAGSLLALVACSSEEGSLGSSNGGGSAASGSATKPAGGGFSADLAKELAMGSAAAEGSAKAADPPRVAEGSAKAAEPPKPADPPKPDDAVKPAADPPKPDDAAPAAAAPPIKMPANGTGPIFQPTNAPQRRAAVPPDIAAIKLTLSPNWERDINEAGTLSFAVKIPGRDQSAVFMFRYGYEDASAPADRDAYKKWLGERKILTVRQDRQAGSAWFIEGTDGSGAPAFRVLVNWGGKKLICYGSLYRDAESSKLGELRDQSILQAKQICETLAL